MTRELGAYGAGGLAFGTALGFISGGTVPVVVALGCFGTKVGLMIGGAVCVADIADRTTTQVLRTLQNVENFSLAGGLSASGVWGTSKLLESHCFGQQPEAFSDQAVYCKALVVGTVAFVTLGLWTAKIAINRLKNLQEPLTPPQQHQPPSYFDSFWNRIGTSCGLSKGSLSCFKQGSD